MVPDGYTEPTGTTDDGTPLQYHQAAVEEKSWGYLAWVAVAKNGGTGQLLAEVHTIDNGLPTEMCPLARTFWRMGGTCQVVTTGGSKVGVVVRPGADDRLDQWAAYRHPDGTVVYVAQSRAATSGDPSMRPLSKVPLSVGRTRRPGRRPALPPGIAVVSAPPAACPATFRQAQAAASAPTGSR